MPAGTVLIPWYATVFRGDKLADALSEIAPVALRYGATDFTVYRSRDDAYKFLQLATFEEKVDFERYWYGPEFSAFRIDVATWYQVPILYVWNDIVVAGSLTGNGNGNGEFVSASAPTEGDTV
jgi:hypothetical protein